MTTLTAQLRASPPAVRSDSGMLPALAGTAVCLLPFLHPAGPGNTAPADVAICASIAVALLWVARVRLPLVFPYLLGVTGLVLGGAFAATLAGAPLSTLLVLVQDALLFGWGMVLVLGADDSRIVQAVTTAWCRTASVYASVVVVAYLVGFSPLSGVTAADGVRAAYTFGDPNLAGNYLVTSLFVLAACRRPRSAPLRHFAYLMLLIAISFTGSNGAMLSLLLGCVLVLAIARYRRRGLLAGLLTLLGSLTVAAILVAYVTTQVNVGAVREKAADSVPLLRDSIARSGGSESQRTTIIGEGYRLFLEGDGTGYGPGRTKSTLQRTQAPYVKEAHNDYLAALLERGVLGEVGLVLLGAAAAIRCGRLFVGHLPEEYAVMLPRAWLLVTIGPIMALSGTFYEVEHFRHLWTWLGLIAALSLVLEREARRSAKSDRQAKVR
ncbi:MAG TPA: O-antigen ligase family protein [Nocardioides sp.]|uniref:O-antigen ligase family protein n=1 Tax=Nocardioides sp. TaxID=35761 RepID=UPI002F3EA760